MAKQRPSHKELTGKLNQAVAALNQGSYAIVEKERHFSDDMNVFQSGSTVDHLAKVL